MEERLNRAVLFEERQADNGARIGVARLNAEKTLNALSLDMIDLLSERLSAWAADPQVVMVLLEASGERAFCAGGDLQQLYKSMLAHHASAQREDAAANEYALAMFSREYRLDYLLHTYPKPILCWGDGIVMGGGLGLMAGASHRVVTDRSKVAMPEINIGLYPDVGGSWLLSRMPGEVGLFLALTAAPMAASDAIFTGVADYQIPQSEKARVVETLLRQPWRIGAREGNDRYLSDVLRSVSITAAETPGPVQRHFDFINALCQRGSLVEIITAITDVTDVTEVTRDDAWLTRAAATLAAGSPSSAALGHALQVRARRMSLAEVFRMELVASMRCAARPDFAEGVRALIIDKDRHPHWQPATHTEITQEWIDGYFESPWRIDDHPLADLGAGEAADTRRNQR